MPVLSRAKHERFAQELAKGSSQIDAYVAAGYARSEAAASRLSSSAKVQARVAELQERGAIRAEITVAGVTEGLLRLASKGEGLGDAPGLSVARAAYMDAAKLNGLVIDRTLNAAATLEELLDRIPPAGGVGL